MRLPRDITGKELAQRLRRFGYESTRQSGSHLRLTTQEAGEHHLTVPLHDPLKLGTLSGILDDVAQHLGITRQRVIERLFD